MYRLIDAIRGPFGDIRRFGEIFFRRPLRDYQLAPARAIIKSVFGDQGHTFAVMMSRQAGKNELSAQVEAFLMYLRQQRGGQIVKAAPTYRPQTLNSLLRLTDRLAMVQQAFPEAAVPYRRREGYMVELGRTRALFFSAEPSANVVGATASLLLEGDEVQDIVAATWDKAFAPMGAATNVTTVFYGTAWTSATFLAQTIAWLEQEQARDGVRRVFRVTADEVAAEVPAYAQFVRREVARLGRDHPLIRTQYYLETIDGRGGLFPPARQALMRGAHPRRHDPEPGHRYALLVDVAGEDEAAGSEVDRLMLAQPRRDATALTVVDVILDRSTRPAARRFHVVDRRLWVGTRHTALHGQLLGLARHWHAIWVVVDATGVGAGLASFLREALGAAQVVPVVFSTGVKSELGWDFVAMVETGRFQDYADDQAPETRQFWYEVGACRYEVAPGPAARMRWGVWETPAYDGLVARGHDDLLVSAALCAVLDRQAIPGDAVGGVVAADDALDAIDGAAW